MIKDNFALVEYQDDDYDLVNFSIQIFGLPLGSKFYRQLSSNLEISQAGYELAWENSN
jgi:hypothetical protein